MDVKDLQKSVYTTRVELSDTGDYFEFRELNMLEFKHLQEIAKNNKKNDEELNEKIFSYFEDIFPSCLVDHSLTSDGVKISVEKAIEALRQSASLYFKVLEKWINDSPFLKRKNSGKSGK